MGVGCFWGSSFPGVWNVKNLPVCKQSCSSRSWCIPFFFFILLYLYICLSRGRISTSGLHKSLSLRDCGDDTRASLLSQHGVSANAQRQCCGQGDGLKDTGRYFQGHRWLRCLNCLRFRHCYVKKSMGRARDWRKNPVTLISGHRGVRRAGFYIRMLRSRAEEGTLRPASKRDNVGDAAKEISLAGPWPGHAEANTWLFALDFGGSLSCWAVETSKVWLSLKELAFNSLTFCGDTISSPDQLPRLNYCCCWKCYFPQN